MTHTVFLRIPRLEKKSRTFKNFKNSRFAQVAEMRQCAGTASTFFWEHSSLCSFLCNILSNRVSGDSGKKTLNIQIFVLGCPIYFKFWQLECTLSFCGWKESEDMLKWDLNEISLQTLTKRWISSHVPKLHKHSVFLWRWIKKLLLSPTGQPIYVLIVVLMGEVSGWGKGAK